MDADAKKKHEKEAKEKEAEAKKLETEASFQSTLIQKLGIELAGSSKAHPPPEKWWNVFKTIFEYDPNSLVHGVLFPQWQIKIPRFLTAHLEAFGASRVDRSGVKFDRLGKTTSGQPIFAVDDATAQEIRATSVLDLSLVRSFGRKSGEKELGLSVKQKEFLVALALWKVQQLLASPFRFRSGCHLRCTDITSGDAAVEISVDIKQAIKDGGFAADPITDVYWPERSSTGRGKDEATSEADGADQNEDEHELESDDCDMRLVLHQEFSLGRFHATPWRANPFDDLMANGHPVPWRLVRAIVARWYRWSREAESELTLDELDRLVAALCTSAYRFSSARAREKRGALSGSPFLASLVGTLRRREELAP